MTPSQLGRGTAPQEGIGLSHAIAESLLNTKVSKTFQRDVSLLLGADGFQAFVFFATHFRDLSMTLGPLSGVVR
jgi:DNA mismatch repair protein MSH4